MRVSVCIPVYNMERCIERAIRSALGQDYPDFEVIVADNRSTDRTYERASSIKDPRLKVFRNDKNLGAYGNHNRCLELAKGEWVKFLHGDDELLPNCVSSMIAALDKCLIHTALLACGAIRHDGHDKEFGRTFVPKELYVMRPVPVSEFMLEGNIIGTPTMVMLHRTSLLGIGGFDVSMEPASDGDCWIYLRTSFPSAYMPDYLVIIRDDEVKNLNEEVRIQLKFCRQIFRQVSKWHKRDPALHELPLEHTPYGQWLCRETFRYWNAGIRFGLRGNLDLLNVLLEELGHYRLIRQSVFNFVHGRLKGLTTATYREVPWPKTLAGLRP